MDDFNALVWPEEDYNALVNSTLYLKALEQREKWLNTAVHGFKGISPLLPNLSYKNITDWESKGLLSPARIKSEEGWRKFSFEDIIRLLIIMDLRKFGLDIPAVKNCLERIFIEEVRVAGKNEKITRKPFFSGSYYLYLCAIGYKQVAIISADGIPVVAPEKQVLISFNNAFGAALGVIIPLYRYVGKIMQGIEWRENTSINQLAKEHPITTEEQKVMAALRSGNFDTIRLQDTNRKGRVIHTEEFKNGNFSKADLEALLEQNKGKKWKMGSDNNGQIITVTFLHSEKI